MAAEQIKLTPDQEAMQAQTLASRYRCEYVDLREGKIDHDLFHSVPVENLGELAAALRVEINGHFG